MICSIKNLKSGIGKYQRYVYRKRHPWRPDFHDTFYRNVTNHLLSTGNLGSSSVGAYYPSNHKGPTLWGDLIAELNYWKALRGRGYNLNYFIHFNYAGLNRCMQFLPSYNPKTPMALNSILPPPPLLNLFVGALMIKPTKQPSIVFASKLCHLILPWEFPVWDREFVGNDWRDELEDQFKKEIEEAYEDLDKVSLGKYNKWKNMVVEYFVYRYVILKDWDSLSSPQKQQLQNTLSSSAHCPRSGKSKSLWKDFPYRTKIPELCI